jgi:sRNA-binding carbon storage regulator CsrA
MLIDLQKKNESIIITLDDGEDIEFTQEDLASIGINAEKAIEVIKDELLEKLV